MNFTYDTASPGLSPDPSDLLAHDSINFDVLKKLNGMSITSADQFDKETVCEISKLAAILECTNLSTQEPLKGKLVITAFFEASTRTRLSFESALLRMDGKIISIPDGNSTGVAKGESLSDIGEMFNAYADAVVIRHTDTDALEEMAKNLRIPLINAGNGSGEHPTQALADWFALLKWKPELKEAELPEDQKIHLGILGSPGSMRTVNSFLRLSLLFKNNIRKISVVSELANPLGEDLTTLLEESGIDFALTNDVKTVISDLDAIYMNSITFLGDRYQSLDANFKINSKSKLKKNAVVLHPLARLDELDPDLDETDHNLYFTQAHGAVFVRQALFLCVLDCLDRIPIREHIPAELELVIEDH